MPGRLVSIILSEDPALRDSAVDAVCGNMSAAAILAECDELDAFRRSCDNLYQRVRALFVLAHLHRYILPAKLDAAAAQGLIPYEGHAHLLHRRFEEAVDLFLAQQSRQGPSDGLSSALSAAYRDLGFQTLANQVRRSVRSVSGNRWMFRVGHPADHPLRLRPELLQRDPLTGAWPTLSERTAVRMDLTHSAWSDIFFLGMDYPQGARVLNVSIDLGVHGRDAHPTPPIETYLRVIDQPVLRLMSLDLGARADVSSLAEVFDFARDYLGLVKAAVIASGLVPPGLEGSEMSLSDVLSKLVGPGLGLEIVSKVNDIPKGSRLAVSTNLLASLISLLMRATGQAKNLQGGLDEPERRVVAARAILGEWIGGSGGGWQDSGGVWPGMKLITGSAAREGDPEFGISRGRLLPDHRILNHEDASALTRKKLAQSLVLVHGGMAQNVGPILEMVTEKYLLRSEREWVARQKAITVLDNVLKALSQGDISAVGAATTDNFNGPIQAIIPAANNLYTQTLIDRTREHFGHDFWGFWMLGGMSGGGMGFIVAPHRRDEAQTFLQQLMSTTKKQLQDALPFAMEPVVYDFAINERGTWAELHTGDHSMMPGPYYAVMVPIWLRSAPADLTAGDRRELERFSALCRSDAGLGRALEGALDRMLPSATDRAGSSATLTTMLAANGFDREQHEQIRSALKAGRIGLAQNRLPANTTIQDVREQDVIDTRAGVSSDVTKLGSAAIASGSVAVLSLAAGVGSRWTQGAGVVKALHPFCKFSGKHRSFIEVHLAKSRRVGNKHSSPVPHLIATSHLTHDAIARGLIARGIDTAAGPVLLSPGRSIGLRMIPTVRDLRFAWEETAHQVLDEQRQKMRQSVQAALLNWARQSGEASDYTDNLPAQCLHPVGHWYEVPNLLRNGVLDALLKQRPGLKHLMLHNIDTLGADVDAGMLGLHMQRGSCLSFEVITRRVDDRGGGLARVDGRTRLLEGLAMPRERDEFDLSYYNTMTTWIDIDQLLAVFGLSRSELGDEAKVTAAIRRVGARVPTYVTLKDVKKRWGRGQEDVFPVAQFEKLWSDMSALPEIECSFFVVPRVRGQQLKDQAQLDGWLRDGSAAHVESLCAW
jgi:hypothetical protein